MKKLNWFFLIAIIIISSCKNSNDDNEKSQENCYFNSNATIIEHNGIDREYVLYVPSSYDATSSTPLMLNFHGYGGTASLFMQDADMRSLADENGFILAYPQGSCLNGDPHWNACPTSNDNKSTADDFGFVESMITKISSEYNIDMERIYAAGYSNGGMMAYGLANYKSNLIAAIASVSGTMLDCYGSTSHPMPLILLHGTSDFVLPYNGNSDSASVDDTLNYWINFNNTNSTAIINSETNNGNTIEHYVYNQGDNNVSVEHYKYIDGEHVWFKNTYQEKNASELVWNFVSKYDINGLR